MTAEEFAAMERRARMFEAANEKMLADNKRLREENAQLRLLVKIAYAEGCYDSTKTEKTQEEFEALWKESFAYNVILEGGKVKAEAACPEPDEAP